MATESGADLAGFDGGVGSGTFSAHGGAAERTAAATSRGRSASPMTASGSATPKGRAPGGSRERVARPPGRRPGSSRHSSRPGSLRQARSASPPPLPPRPRRSRAHHPRVLISHDEGRDPPDDLVARPAGRVVDPEPRDEVEIPASACIEEVRALSARQRDPSRAGSRARDAVAGRSCTRPPCPSAIAARHVPAIAPPRWRPLWLTASEPRPLSPRAGWSGSLLMVAGLHEIVECRAWPAELDTGPGAVQCGRGSGSSIARATHLRHRRQRANE